MDSQTFIEALRRLEQGGDVETIAGLYAEEARLWNPELGEELVGRDGARHFWSEYRATFDGVESRFRLTLEQEGRAALEWTSSGTMRAGQQPFRYRGVSMLEWNDRGITRFAAYFDPQALRIDTPHQAHQAHRPDPRHADAAADRTSGGRTEGGAEIRGGYGADSGFAQPPGGVTS